MNELETVPTDGSKLSNVVDADKETVYEELVKKVNAVHVGDTSTLVTKTGWNTIFHDRLKQANLATKSDIADFITKMYFHKKLKTQKSELSKTIS